MNPIFKAFLILLLFFTNKFSNANELSASEVIGRNKIHFDQISQLIEMDDKKGIENKLLSIIQDKKITINKKLTNYLFIYISSNITKKFDCLNDSNFIFNFLTAKSTNERTSKLEIQKIILIEDIIKELKKQKKLNEACLNKLYETVLNAAQFEITSRSDTDKYKIIRIIGLLNKASEELSDEQREKLKFNIYYYFFITDLMALNDNKIQNEGFDYYYELKQYHNQAINEKIIVENEIVFLDTNTSTKDEIFFSKLTFIIKYLREDYWPFNSSKVEYVNKLYDRKFKDKVKRDFFLIASSEVLIKHLNEKSPEKAKLAYKEILNLNTNKLPSKFKGSYGEFFPLMLDGFKLRAALNINDLKSAEKIFSENIKKIYNLQNNKSISELNKNNPDSFAILISPYFNYSIFMKDSENSKFLISLVNKSVEFDLSRIEDEEYIKKNKIIYKNKLNTYLVINEDYLEFIGEDKNKINKIYRAFHPYSFKDFSTYIKHLMGNLSSYDIEAAKFYLDIFKEDLPNFTQSKSNQLVLELYNTFFIALEAYPGDASSNEDKFKWFDSLFRDYLDIYSLVYLNEYNTAAYGNKLFDSFTLFELNLKTERYEEAYYFSIEYLNNISTGFKNISADYNLNSKFKTSISINIDKIIDFYIENNKSNDAINAISIYKIQQFHDAIQRTGLDHRVTYNNKNDLLRKNISNELAELNYKNSRSKDANEFENKNNFESVKLSLKNELQKIYLNSQISIKKETGSYKIAKSSDIPTDLLFIDYYIKSENLNIILSSPYGNKIISTSIPNNFNNNIIKLIELYSKPSSLKVEIDELNNYLFSFLFEPIMAEVLDKKINTIYFRSNGLLPLLPIKNIIFSNDKISKFINVAYEGIESNTKFSSSNRFNNSSLFATDQKYGNLPALKFAKKEVELVRNIFDKNYTKSIKNKIFLNSAFTFDNLLNEFKSNVNVIHIASHFSHNNSGSLLLGNGNLITSQELWNKLPNTSSSKLITISACESGLIFEEGKIFENLPNVFLDKGASLVVASKWKIADESTAYFMDIFYKILLVTNDPITALNMTQLIFHDANYELLENKFNIILSNSMKSILKKYNHPFYWASFQIVSAKR
jgi:CHAT domain-containing protein